MTLIVGWLSKEGAVIAADSLSTLGAGGRMTSTQAGVQKISNVKDRALVATSGSVSLAQAVESGITKAVSDGSYWQKKTLADAASVIFKYAKEPINEVRQQISISANQMGDPNMMKAGYFSSVIGIIFDSGQNFGLLELQKEGIIELKGLEVPYVSIGSGQSSADPFLNFTYQAIGKGKPLSLAAATTAAIWTVEHGIDCSVGGVGGSTNVARIEHVGGKDGAYTIVAFDDGMVQQHIARVEALQSRISDVYDKLIEEETKANAS